MLQIGRKRERERERERACKALIGMQLDLQWGRFVFLDAGPLKANQNYRQLPTSTNLPIVWKLENFSVGSKVFS